MSILSLPLSSKELAEQILKANPSELRGIVRELNSEEIDAFDVQRFNEAQAYGNQILAQCFHDKTKSFSQIAASILYDEVLFVELYGHMRCVDIKKNHQPLYFDSEILKNLRAMTRNSPKAQQALQHRVLPEILKTHLQIPPSIDNNIENNKSDEDDKANNVRRLSGATKLAMILNCYESGNDNSGTHPIFNVNSDLSYHLRGQCSPQAAVCLYIIDAICPSLQLAIRRYRPTMLEALRQDGLQVQDVELLACALKEIKMPWHQFYNHLSLTTSSEFVDYLENNPVAIAHHEQRLIEKTLFNENRKTNKKLKNKASTTTDIASKTTVFKL